jgi:hypothetical protein
MLTMVFYSSIISNVAPKIEAFMQYGAICHSHLQLEDHSRHVLTVRFLQLEDHSKHVLTVRFLQLEDGSSS